MAKKSSRRKSGSVAAGTTETDTGGLLSRARLLFDQQDYVAVRDLLNEAEPGNSGYLAARQLIARTYLQDRDNQAFLQESEKLAREFPNNPQCHHLCGIAYFQLYKLDTAEQSFRKALSLNPDDHPSAENLGIVLDRNGWKRESYTQLYKTLDKTGKLGRAGFIALIRNALLVGDKKTAYDAVRFVLKGAPNDPEVIHLEARVAFAHYDFEGGKRLLKRGLAQHHNSPELIVDNGIYALSSGDVDNAAKSFRRAIQIDPNHSSAHYTLADMGGGASDAITDDREDRLVQMRTAIQSPEVPYIDKAELGFSAGKVLDSLKRYDEAFGFYDDANRRIWARLPVHTYHGDQVFQLTKRVFDKQIFSNLGTTDPDAGAGMVFLVGMPRSGTTLLEQMLSRLPKEKAGGETAELENISGQLPKLLGKSGSYPGVLTDATSSELDQLSVKFMSQFRTEIDVGSWRTNKDMGLYMHLGLIALLFPAARIIHCRRNALDTCVSAYFQFFKLYHLPYSFDLAGLAQHFRAYHNIMEHWQDNLPMPILDFDYEDLTIDPERAIRRVSEFCGMEWSDDCLDFEKTDSLIKTASIWQVRQGMHQNSVNRWRRYEKHLTPLIDELGELAEI